MHDKVIFFYFLHDHLSSHPVSNWWWMKTSLNLINDDIIIMIIWMIWLMTNHDVCFQIPYQFRYQTNSSLKYMRTVKITSVWHCLYVHCIYWIFCILSSSKLDQRTKRYFRCLGLRYHLTLSGRRITGTKNYVDETRRWNISHHKWIHKFKIILKYISTHLVCMLLIESEWFNCLINASERNRGRGWDYQDKKFSHLI